MDLSKLSDADLIALQNRDLSKVSDAGLAYLQGAAPEAPQKAKATLSQDIKQGLGNLAAGAVHGAGSIGATLLSPVDAALDFFNRGGFGDKVSEKTLSGLVTDKKPLTRNEQRRADMDAALQTMGADPESLLYKGGKIGAEIAGTAGAGGVLAKGASLIPGVAKAAPALIEALRTGGMASGPMAARVAGGAATGAASAGLVNPEEAGTGAKIGVALPVVGKVLQVAGTLAKKAIGGTTGVGDEALTQAFQAGKAGGQAAEDFTSAMRGQSNMDDVLTMAKQNLAEMGAQKQAAYRQGMAGIKADKTVLDLKNVDQAVNDALGMATYKGQIKNERAAQALSNIKGEIDNWKSLDPAEFHTPEGFDALKQKIGGILEDIPFEQKTARSAAGKVYDSLRAEISKQAPEYSKVMKGYSEASETIKEIEKALSLGNKASADTAMRKLQSLMRNNVNTNYGQRTKLAELLQQSGGQDFMPALAGQSLNAAMPRGIQQALSGTGGAGLALTGNVPAAAGLAAVSSPRLMGEAFYGAGKAAGAVDPRLIEALRTGLYRGAPVAGAQ